MIIAAFVFLLPPSVRSETREGSTELGLFGGYHLFDNGQNLKNRPVFGGLVGYNITDHLGIEGTVKVIKSRVDDTGNMDGREGRFRSPADKVRLTFYDVDAVYHFRPIWQQGNFDPFVTAGVGMAKYSPSISTKAMTAFNIGVGTKYWIRDNIALRIDLRDNMVTEVFQETFHNFEVTVGATVALGGKKKAAPAPAVKVEAKPEPPKPVVAAKPEPKAVEPVVILVAEPEVEKKIVALVAQPEIEKKVIILALEDINFDFDKSTLTPAGKEILVKNIQTLKDNPKTNILIAGYTSASGSNEYNQKLSERRATAVRDALIEGGIAPERLWKIGYGESRPATFEPYPEEIESTAAKSNMRVLFTIIVK